MTSKNSFWVSSRENHKRRIWVWVVAVLSQLLLYGGMTMIYLSRIKSDQMDGVYRTQQAFQDALYQAGKDALGFSDNLYGIVFLLAAMIAMQGFSYLYDRRKVDLYHSVPVSKTGRFAVVYVNGLLIWLAANLSGLALGMVVAAAQRAVNADVLAAAGLAFVWNLAFFLVFYHAMILAVMLTGNRFVTICVFLTFTLYQAGVYSLLDSMKRTFFHTYSQSFTDAGPKLSVYADCMNNIYRIKTSPDAAAMAAVALPLVGKWILIAAALFALAWISYRKRPSETAGKSLAFAWLKPVGKVAVAVPVALMIGMMVYNTSYANELLQVAGMLVGGVLLCAALEVLYDFDIRSIFKHPISSGVALLGILAVFCIFKWDLFGYDRYIPAQNKVESIAILVDGYYDNYWDYDSSQYIGDGDFIKEHMFLTDTEPILELAALWQPKKLEEGDSIRILYRLSSGAEKERTIRVDFDDPETEALLNRTFGTDAFKKGVFQAAADSRTAENVKRVTYTNGAVRVTVPVKEAAALREAWLKDMERFDFSMARHSLPCGYFNFEYEDYYTGRDFYVYDGFENTIACLKRQNAWYPMALDAADVDSITVTCFHNELAEADQWDDGAVMPRTKEMSAVSADTYVDYAVQETFYGEEEIAQILPHLYSAGMNMLWGDDRALDNNYAVEVIFKRDSAYPYERTNYYFSYEFPAGQVPDFVAEATAYTP